MPKGVINPLALVAAKQKVGEDDANEIALPVLVHLDAAKRGQGTAAGFNHLVLHVIIAAHVAAGTKSRTFYDCATRAYAALLKAGERKTKLLDLTTGEYASLRAAISMYLRALPNLEVGRLNQACEHGARIMAEH